MPQHEILTPPGLVPVNSEVAMLAASMNERIYDNPRIYKAAIESGRLITDTGVVHYAPMEGEDEALSAINEFIAADQSRRIELDTASDELLYKDPDHVALLSRFVKSSGNSQREKLKEVTASRLGFVISRIVTFEEARQVKRRRTIAKAG